MTQGGRVLRNLLSLSTAEGATRLLSLVTAAYLARVVGPAGYGIWGFAVSITAYFLIAVNFGLETLGTREVARDPEATRRYVNQIVSARIVNALLAYSAYAAVVLLLLDPEPAHRAVLLIVGLGLFVQSLNLEWVYRGNQRMGVIALRRLLTSAVNLAGVLLLVHGPDDLVLAAVVTVAANLVNILWLLGFYVRDIAAMRPGTDGVFWRRLLRTALPMATSEFAILIYYRLDVVMLGILRPASEVGLYYAVYNVFLVATVPANIILQVFFPRLAQAEPGSPDGRRTMRDYSRLMLAVGVPLSATFALFGHELLTLIFGLDYASASPVLMLLMVNSVLVYTNMVLGNPLLAWDREKLYMRMTIYGGLSNIVLNVALIPTWGMMGAAIATLGAETVVLVALATAHRRLTGELYVPTLLACMAVALGAVVAAFLLTGRLEWWLTAATIGVFSVIGFRLAGFFRFGDLYPMLAGTDR